jgi:small subunit ribosomal protein S18
MAVHPRATTHRAGRGSRHAAHPPCALCRDNVDWVDYKNVALLRTYVSGRGRIRARRVTGNCARHQTEIAMAIKTARELVLLPRPAPQVPKAAETTDARGGSR